MLTKIEQQLLRHYSAYERAIRGAQRSVQHQRLLALGFISEQSLGTIQDQVIVVTPAGRAALGDDPGVV
jgi:hypothetical protein